ncbi:MAG: hypothetical protein HY296_04590 [Thaumarchaeota archaeon]|nr:hypothetical protein [Nitrososphaerota archaeon]
MATTMLELNEGNLVNPPAVYEKVDSLITCFRLFKQGYIAAYPVVAEVWDENLGEFLYSYEFGISMLGPQGGVVYGLGQDEIGPLAEFAKNVLPVLSSEEFRSLGNPAFRFFNRGIDDMQRNDMPMAIVDFVGSIEALLGTSQTELIHRLSQTVAILTERLPTKRREKYDQFRRIYGIRSKAIHGEKLGDEVGQVVFAEVIARSVLKVCLEYFLVGQNKDKVLQDVNDVIFGVSADLSIFNKSQQSAR